MENQKHRIDRSSKIAPTSKLERVAYRRLFNMSSPADFSVDLAVPVIKANPAITQRLFNFVNSTNRISHRKIVDIRHAVTILGANGIREFSEAVIQSMDAKAGTSPDDPVNETASSAESQLS